MIVHAAAIASSRVSSVVVGVMYTVAGVWTPAQIGMLAPSLQATCMLSPEAIVLAERCRDSRDVWTFFARMYCTGCDRLLSNDAINSVEFKAMTINTSNDGRSLVSTASAFEDSQSQHPRPLLRRDIAKHLL